MSTTGEVSVLQDAELEDLDAYRQGGFHPVNLGDRLSEYIVVNKLGHGDTSTVWLAKEVDGDRCAAISVNAAEYSEVAKSRVCERWWRLRSGAHDHLGRSNVLLPELFFDITGPNGTHFCVVLPVEGQTVSAATDRGNPTSHPLPLAIAKRMIVDYIHGLEYAHSISLCHGDLHPANVLLGLPPEVASSTEAMTRLFGPPRVHSLIDNSNLARRDRRPNHLVEGIFSRKLSLDLFTGPAKIADWSECYLSEEPPQRTTWLGPYITPEFNSPEHISAAGDVWCLGCGVYQALTGRDLFGLKDQPAHIVLNSMMDHLGPPPEYLFADWQAHCGEESTLSARRSVVKPLDVVLREGITAHQSQNLTEDEIDLLVEFLQYILVYEPSIRPTISNVARHSAVRQLLSM